jgi:DNA modification methylase
MTKRRANELNGREWLRYSISVWSDIRKTPEEITLSHPALFPQALVERVLACFTTRADRVVLDPFAGVGSALLAACATGRHAVGVELNPDYVALARRRLLEAGYRESSSEVPSSPDEDLPATFALVQADARQLFQYVPASNVDFCVTSPPYWDILRQRRTADGKTVRHYAAGERDLGAITDYELFLDELTAVFETVHAALRPGAYCVVVVMDLRKKSRFFPFHSDLAIRMQALGPSAGVQQPAPPRLPLQVPGQQGPRVPAHLSKKVASTFCV